MEQFSETLRALAARVAWLERRQGRAALDPDDFAPAWEPPFAPTADEATLKVTGNAGSSSDLYSAVEVYHNQSLEGWTTLPGGIEVPAYQLQEVNGTAGISNDTIVRAWPTSGADGAGWAFDAGSAGRRVVVRKNSAAPEYVRRRLNLIQGSNVTLTVADDPTDNEVDVTIAASGGISGIEVKEADGSPDQTGVTVLTVNQATGLEVSATGAGAATLGLRAATATQQGAVTTGSQTWDGPKTFLNNIIASSAILANAGILCTGNLELYPAGVGTKYGTLGAISSYTYLYHLISGVGTMYLLVDQPNNRLVATTLSGSGNTKFAVESSGTVVNGVGGTNDIGDQFLGGLFTGTTAGGLPSVTPRWVTAPATATSSGTAGQIAKDGSFFYVCTATNTWRRVAIASW